MEELTLVWVRVGEESYLGKVSKSEDGTTCITDACTGSKGHPKSTIDLWIKTDNLKELSDVSVNAATGLAITELNKTEKTRLTNAQAKMVIAKDTAVAEIENKLFDEMDE